MFRTISCCAAILWLSIVTVNADWTIPEQVNETEYEYGLSACRDSDTPWGIAVDTEGNVHFVMETEGEGEHTLNIHYRVKRASGIWTDELSVTAEEPLRTDPNYNHEFFGHPSIIINEDLEGLICYNMDKQGGEIRIEPRAVQLDFALYPQPFGDYEFMSLEDEPYMKSRGVSGGRKVPVMSMDNSGVIYGFWPYFIDGKFQIWCNTYSEESWSESEWALPSIDIEEYPDYMINTINTLADPNGDIHLAIEMILDPSDESYEIYHCWYDVIAEEWSDLEIVSEPYQPDGNHSTLPYLAFSGGPSDYKMYVVWEDVVDEDKQVRLRKYNKESISWDTEILISSPNAEKPCVAAISNGDIYVVWGDGIASGHWIYYKVYDNSSAAWSTLQTLTNNPNVDSMSIPTIISDRWDNLHLAAIGYLQNADPNDHEAFYSFFDALPHAPQNLAQVFTGPPRYITITWDANSEPDLDGYMIIRRYHEKTWLDTLATVDDTVTTYVDTEIPHVGGETPNYVRYWVEAIDTAGQHSPKSDSLQCAVPNNWEPPKLVADGSIPAHFDLTGNYPNPFNASTEINYALPFNAHVTLEIYDILGRKTVTLIDEYQEAGFKTAHWNGRGANGSEVSTGVYIYRLSAGGLAQSKRMIILK